MKFPDYILNFLKEPFPLVLGTANKAGQPQVTIVWFEYKNGVFMISTTKNCLKYKNILDNPRVSFAIYNPGNAFNYLQVSGKVVKTEDDPDNGFKKRLTTRYAGKDWPAYTDRIDDRVIIHIAPERYRWTAKTLLK